MTDKELLLDHILTPYKDQGHSLLEVMQIIRDLRCMADREEEERGNDPQNYTKNRVERMREFAQEVENWMHERLGW